MVDPVASILFGKDVMGGDTSDKPLPGPPATDANSDGDETRSPPPCSGTAVCPANAAIVANVLALQDALDM